MTEYKALVDLVVAEKPVKAGQMFEASDEQAEPAVAFGLAERVKREHEHERSERVEHEHEHEREKSRTRRKTSS